MTNTERNPADVQDIVERLRSEKQWNYEGPQTKFFAGKDIEYAYGLEACVDEGQYDGAKNVSDLIGMVKWNALGLIQSADEIERLRAALQQSRSAVEILAEVFADHDKVNSLDWTDRAGAVLSQESADA